MTSALLLANPAAGRHPLDSERLAVLRQMLREAGFECRVAQTRPGPDPVPRLDLTEHDALIVYGGDGTLHAALDQVVSLGCPVGLLPMGTANVLARELGIPLGLSAAIKVLKQGRLRRIHLGHCQAGYFHLMTGVGLDGYVISHVNRRLKRRLGRAAYWEAGFRSFWSYPLQEIEVRLDGEELLKATFVVVSKVVRYGGNLCLAPGADPFQTGFQVCLFQSSKRLRYFVYLASLLRKRHVRLPDVVCRRADRVEIRGSSDVPVQMDGELQGSLPLTFSGEAEIEMFVP